MDRKELVIVINFYYKLIFIIIVWFCFFRYFGDVCSFFFILRRK